MAIDKRVFLVLLIPLALALAGCARSASDTAGFAVSQSAAVGAPFDQAWQTVKAVLREYEKPNRFEIYTRDRRGVFVAFENTGRQAFLVPSRVQYTVSVEPAGENASQVTVETIRQVYGVTLLTYPGWHDRPMKDPAKAQGLLGEIQARIAGGSPEAKTQAPA
ncbi:MAG: hypothetical protein NTZ09_00820 [Candidatus Hydrogenedentes bacterium]|nr:hypothetical protein [Candidatus Hydrogenedentota bacterium]